MSATAARVERRRRRRPTFEELVRLSIAGALLPGEIEHLESEACLERYVNELARLASDAKTRIENRRHDRTVDLDELFALSDGIGRLMPRLKAKLRDHNRAVAEQGDAALLRRENTRLRAAIRRHRNLSRDADLEPEPHDLELWGNVILKASTGARS